MSTDAGQAAGSPAFPGPVTGALFAATAGYSATLIDLENQAAQVASAPLRARIAEILRRLTALYTRLAGSPDAPLPPQRAPQLLAELTAELGSLRGLDPSPVVADFASRAYHAAVAFSQEQIGPLAVDRLPGALADDALSQALDSLPGSVAARIDDALRFAQQTPAADLNTAVLQPVAKANQAANTAEAAARWAVNRGANTGVAHAAEQKDAFLLWAGEPTACFISSTRVLAPAVLVEPPARPATLMSSDPLDRNALGPSSPSVGASRHPGLLATTASAAALRDRFREVKSVSSREYVGDIVRIRTTSGKELTGTPNHPVATRGGWIPLGQLGVGDHVLSRSRRERVPFGVDPDDNNAPPTIEQVAQAFPVTVGVVPTAPEDFHGDGAGSQVHVVRADGLLLPDLQAVSPQHRGELVFKRRDVGLKTFAGKCLGVFRSLSSWFAELGGNHAFTQLAPLLGRELMTSAQVVAGRDALALEPSLGRRHADAVDYGDFLERLASIVELDKIVDVWHGKFRGQVHNLETVEGWYLAEDIVVHNCVHCAAYIGHYVRPGDSFPTNLTFGDKPLTPWPDPDRLDGPPLHPNCRCRLIAWLGPVATHPVDTAIYNRPALQDQVDLAAAMRREAKRAVLRGWSLPSESESVRLRAADRLLRRGAGLPKSVEARARKAVQAKRFPDRHVR